MRKPPYVGVTGFMTPQEVRAALKYALPDRGLMVGVLASFKTLMGGTNRYPHQFPRVERITEIFQEHPAAVNLIHYSTDVPEKLLSVQLERLRELGGPHLHGFQLNIAWPPPQEIKYFKNMVWPDARIVLQIPRRAMEGQDVVVCLRDYVDLVDDVLIDASEGRGEPLNQERTLALVRAVTHGAYPFERRCPFNVGVAGGLGLDTLHLLEPIIAEFPDINFDAQWELRDRTTEDLEVTRMVEYLQGAQHLIKQQRQPKEWRGIPTTHSTADP